MVEAFDQADTAEVIRLLDQIYGKDIFSLRQLFRDEQRKITNLILTDSLNSAAAVYRTVFESQAPLIRFLNGLEIPVPNALKSAAEIALNNQFQQHLERPELDAEGIQSLLREAAASKITLDGTTLEFKVRRRIEKEAAEFAANPTDLQRRRADDQVARSGSIAAVSRCAVGSAKSSVSTAARLPISKTAGILRAQIAVAAHRHEDLNRLATSTPHSAAARLEMPPTRLPSATYRIQLNPDFRFADALKILDYLHQLGISDLYLSPILASRKGSMHGYDVIDPSRINPDLGSEEEFNALQTELQNRGMGLLLDIVPNHMAASAENPWWMDVLENGAQSAFAGFFDIEWHPHARSLEGRILLPVLGRPFGEALDSGEIKLIYNEGRFFIQYFESLFPVSPRSYHAILNLHAGRLKDSLSPEDVLPTTNIRAFFPLRLNSRALIGASQRVPPSSVCVLNQLVTACAR